MDPIASIIITTYKRPGVLRERSLRSALNQNFENYEIIVVDDASGLDYSDLKVRVIVHEKNKGLSAARNTGIKAARGKYIVCLDDDNELAPNFLKRTTEVIGDYDAVYTGRVIQYKDFADIVFAEPSKFTSIDWGWLIQREVFEKIQYDEQMRANEDTDFGIRFWKQFKAIGINEPLQVAHDEFGDPKKSLSYPTERELIGMIYFFKKNWNEYQGYPKEMWHLHKLMGRKFYRGGYRRAGLFFFWKGFRAYPRPRSFAHLLFLLLGWKIYDSYMTLEEKLGARLRRWSM